MPGVAVHALNLNQGYDEWMNVSLTVAQSELHKFGVAVHIVSQDQGDVANTSIKNFFWTNTIAYNGKALLVSLWIWKTIVE